MELELDKLNYSLEAGADMLAVSAHTLARDVRLGRIQAVRYGRRILIPREEILRIAREGMKPLAERDCA